MANPSRNNDAPRPTASSRDRNVSPHDIADLYSRLQLAMDNVHSKLDHVHHKYIPMASSLPVTPSSSTPRLSHQIIKRVPSPLTLPRDSSATSTNDQCACRHILASNDASHCALCSQEISVVIDLRQLCQQQLREIQSLQSCVVKNHSRLVEQQKVIDQQTTSSEILVQQLETQTRQLGSLRQDMVVLDSKYRREVDRLQKTERAKTLLEGELEELSRNLFEEANRMVATEKRAKHELQTKYNHLEARLKDTQAQLHAEQMQLKELRSRMQMMDKQPSEKDSVYKSHPGTAEQKHHSLTDDGSETENGIPANPDALPGWVGREHLAVFDPMALYEFQEFVKLGNSVPLKRLHTIPFLRNCQMEDTEPCLRFGPHPRFSARKINDAIANNVCFIEIAPSGFAKQQMNRALTVPLHFSASKSMVWERFSSSSSTSHSASAVLACHACGRHDTKGLPYRFRISPMDDWACIDKFCRDRLVAVCEFYLFVRNLRQGYYSNRSLPDLYQEVIRLKLQMFYARMGNLSSKIESLDLDHGNRTCLPSAPLSNMPSPPVNLSKNDETGNEEKEKSETQ
ncbi:uncharacterized protein BYT42DRAFT_610225 [Radiomyces spectabilis]|uniref:uncharacterized protein n=1 Tax=Radiomyces spectabilis TaxID=64574 RepID=UPI00221EB5A0|nr:uncharacterized protein BYT42DRAFT_610225 [Radiomyces spectabilis]KAI8390956.1 hypothetical protein BYT42DRAFT_610225 [Radiomyces spectabilis]